MAECICSLSVVQSNRHYNLRSHFEVTVGVRVVFAVDLTISKNVKCKLPYIDNTCVLLQFVSFMKEIM